MSPVPLPWQPRTIRGIVAEAKPTASQVVVVETDQGDGYLKAMGNTAGTHSLAIELVATRLAEWFGLPTLTAAIIDVTGVPEIRLQEEPTRMATPGPAYITKAEGGGPWRGEREELDRIDNPDDLSRVVIFDTWARNCDRYLPRPGQPPHINRDNLFLSTEGASRGQVVLKPIDHAQCFCFATVLTPEMLRAKSAVQDERLFGYFSEFQGRVSEQAVRKAIGQAASISESEVDALFVGMPTQWKITDDLRAAWCELILGRAAFLLHDADRICSLL